MAETIEGAAATNQTDPAPSHTTRLNGQTDEQVRRMYAAFERRKNDPGYLQRLRDGAQEARRRMNEEFLRELDAEESK